MDQSLSPLAAHGAAQPAGARQIVLHDYIDADARIERLTTQIAALMPSWSLAPVVEAIQAMRGPRQGSRTRGDTLPRHSLSR